jgi:hypothetical protein
MYIVETDDHQVLEVPLARVRLDYDAPMRQPWHGCLVMRHRGRSQAFQSLIAEKPITGLTLAGRPATAKDVMFMCGTARVWIRGRASVLTGLRL